MPTLSPLNTVEIQHRRQSPNGLTNIGTRENPIYVFGDNEVQCEGCWEEGHLIGDCNREYPSDGRQYLPISEGENLIEPTYIVDKDYYRWESPRFQTESGKFTTLIGH